MRHGLEGWVRNRSDGVEIEVSGEHGRVSDFISDISARPPSLARIVAVEAADLPFEPLGAFRIVESSPDQARTTLISPDVSICPDCLRELLDPADRRYRYPFINCTNCGPRYTIIKDIPYDRDKTTMAQFEMCPQCRAEYHNPMDRRFHAQPNACAECGPHVWIEDSEGGLVASHDDAVRVGVELLASGAILAVKGLGGFHLAANATDEAAVSRLRSRKIREEKPFAVMFSSLDEISRHCHVDAAEKELLLTAARPIVLLRKRGAYTSASAKERLPIAPSVAPRNRYFGAFLPYTPLHFLLFEGAPYKTLVMTSGNRSDEPIVIEDSDARSRLKGIADNFLLHDRQIYMRCDDSVTRVLDGKPYPIRRARGYVPVPVFLKDSGPSVLGTGAELKNTVCLTRGNEAFLSQHIGDLENLETLHSFEHAIAHLEQILEINPELVVHDLHPDYLSTRWALGQRRLPVLAAQHHHAHIASVMAERGLEGPLIGLALDGTGFGADGTIWGGEVLKVETGGFERLGHFRHTLLPGGEKAIKEPWRMALSYLWGLDPEGAGTRFSDLLATRSGTEKKIVLQMLSRRLNSPVTSSCGRLFDAVAALCGLRDSVVYEGQAAIELEQAIEPEAGFFGGKITPDEDDPAKFIIDPFPMIEAVVEDVRRKIRVGKISARFHNGMVGLLAGAAQAAARICGLKRIALSGGVFQNAYLSERLKKELSGLGFEVYTHALVPANDACISLGQAYIGRKQGARS
jgi:hydrogenase maturation protein HypF